MTAPAPSPPRDAHTLAEDVARVRDELTRELLDGRNAAGHWRGGLASSALSTAVASFALTLFDRTVGGDRHAELVEQGLDWLSAHANEDGGWGDTVRSASNLPTTLLSWAALRAGPRRDRRRLAVGRAEDWIRERAGSLEPEALKNTVEALYGKDKTFSVPILTLAALAGVLGPEPEAWDGPPALPFELAALPQGLFRFLGLPVVSYALPALIAVGQVRHRRRPSRNPLVRGLRHAAEAKTLDRLESILPASGGFLEAIPLTAFVTLSLVGAGQAEHRVTDGCLEFLRDSQRPDGSWPIDIDLATWVTTLSIQGLGACDRLADLPQAERQSLRRWLLDQQYTERHPFTGADPGGWAWTDLPGGVPDADDTAGALLALATLGPIDEEAARAADAAVRWLMGLQNRDGGIPTFCRGWTRLPFDASAPDLTAHALRAFRAWRPHLPPRTVQRMDRATARAVRYLQREQRPDGSWVPLWFGHEGAPDRENKVFGTARVLAAAKVPGTSSKVPGAYESSQEQFTGSVPKVTTPVPELTDTVSELTGPVPGQKVPGTYGKVPGTAQKVPRTYGKVPGTDAGRRYLLSVQNPDGGWGGGLDVPSSVEETALAITALADVETPEARRAVARGLRLLVTEWDRDRFREAAPIGFYFANLWYFEDLYPHAFALAALGAAGDLGK